MNQYDIIILDWLLPKMDGVQVCKTLRNEKVITPILMLTAKSDIDDKIESLECGVDEYLTKPFVFRELVAVIRSLIRRAAYNHNENIKLDTLELNIPKRLVTRSGKHIELTTKEFDILMYMLSNRGSIVTHTILQEKIWGINEITSSNVINVFIHHLRKKIDIEGEKTLIKTVRGSGYKIET
jgi:DNA-binding response OmpR family regulator